MVRKLQVIEARPGSLRLQVELAVGLRAFLPIVAGGDVLAAGETSAGVTHFSLR